MSLHNLALSLSTRFKHKGELRDLEDGISYAREALVALTPLNSLSFNRTANMPSHGSVSNSSDHPVRLKFLLALVSFLKTRYAALREDRDAEEIFQVLRAGLDCIGSSLLARLSHITVWGAFSREFARHRLALEAYGHGIKLLPLLASLDMTLEQRKNALIHTKTLSSDAVQSSIEQNELETAVVYLSTARSIFWSQALQLRGSLDKLEASHPSLASELRAVNRQLENATHLNNMVFDDFVHAPSLTTSPYLLAQQREKLLATVRGMEGFNDFLLPPSFDTLKHAAREGPVIFLNASKYGCHALILKHDFTLLALPLSTNIEQLANLKMAVHRLAQGHAFDGTIRNCLDDIAGTRKLLGRLSRRHKTVDDDFRELLEVLWLVVGEPVIRALEVQKTETPPRLWWCATGPFAFLPIHAAGVYSNDGTSIDCVSDYVVSSYCSSPNDLILPPPPNPNPDFKMLVAIEPEWSQPGISSLPMTKLELKKIESCIPDRRHLVARIGTSDAPTNPTEILEEIKTSSIVHFGCHGSQDASNPLDSSLILSGGRLTVSSLIRNCQTSEAALAYLSACEMAMGDEQRPDESLSLAATMQFAGFRGVVATMWSIHDADGPIVADIFYQHLFRNGSDSLPDITDAAYGLHLAVKELRNLGRPFHHWVPFVHHGV
ncbi:hypothetical protein CC2G_014136 [Coprinopsis cinerea AmutBmut pab1-1]|nr:hypothetical protein CC2G_014136 [Coprinopsis cinerea AmutBmut pab1-1]